MNNVSVVGTRPQFIKASLLYKEMPHHIIDTGQHYDEVMNSQYFDEFGIEPQVLSSDGDVSGMYKRLLGVLAGYDSVIVYGDCNTTLAGALAAKYLNKRLVHIEAGCRSFNRRMVEESIRITVDHMANLNICSSSASFHNLRAENMHSVFLGDLAQDYIDSYEHTKASFEIGAVTIHRAENMEHMDEILDILSKVPHKLIWPQHPKMRRFNLPGNVKAVDPLPYNIMIDFIANAPFIITDSGGLQKEAYMLKTKCITMRDDTEWPETLANGWNTLCGIDAKKVLRALKQKPEQWTPDLYGHDVAQRIAEHVG